MKLKTLLISVAAVVALAGCEDTASVSSGPSVGSASDISAFEGAPAGQGESGIQALGYELVRNEGLTNFWSNPNTGACARITTSQGRYSDVTMVPTGNC